MIRALWTITLALILPTSALAADRFTDPSPSSQDLVYRLVFLTTLLVVLCILISWWAKRALQLPALPPAPFLQPLDTITLRSGQTIHLLQVGSSQLAISVNPDGIETLCWVTPTFRKLLEGSSAHSSSLTRQVG